MSQHPLLAVLHAAAGEFPPADGRAVLLPPLPYGHAAVVSLTGRVYLATHHRIPELDGFGSALHPAVPQRLAGPAGRIGTLDVPLAAHDLGGGALPARDDLADHPRARPARALREKVRVCGDDRGLVTVGAGLAGRTEISVEVFAATEASPCGRESLGHTESGNRGPVSWRGRDRGVGRGLIREALRLVPVGEPVFAAVAPGQCPFAACRSRRGVRAHRQ